MINIAGKPVSLIVAGLCLQGPVESREPDPLYASNDTLQVTLEAPFTLLMRERDEGQEHPGKLRYTDTDGTTVELGVQVRTRGKFRARKAVCNFAPIRLNFRTSEVKGTLFAKQDKLKLVTHCDSKSERYEQTVITEYLAYRILNLMTDFSYRVRLLRITYEYSDSKRKKDSFAILIESDERLAKRIEHSLIATEKLRLADLNPEYTNLVSVYQYLIGNTDFSPIAAAEGEECCHNHTPYSADNKVYFSIPYDLDQCGLVDSPHASPNPRFRLRTVRHRLYRGRCINNDILPTTLDLFREKRPDIEALVAGQAELAPRTRYRTESFVRSFYRTIDNPKSVKRLIVKRCN